MTSVFFALQPFIYWFIALFTGLLFVLAVYLTWGRYPRFRRGEALKGEPEPRGYEVKDLRALLRDPVWPWVATLFAIVILSIALYYIIIGLHGGAVG